MPSLKIKFSNCEIDTAARLLRRDGMPVQVEPQVFDVLIELISARGRVLTKDELVERVWNGRVVSDTAISSRIKDVRAAVGDDGEAQAIIKTHRGVGYQFVANLNEDRWEVDRPVGRTEPRVLVLPFEQMPENPETLWRLDGICTDVISALARFRELRVISNISSFSLRDLKGVDLTTAIRQMDADFLVAGNLRELEDHWRLQITLSSAENNEQIWSERWSLSEDDFRNLDVVVDAIVSIIEPELLLVERTRLARKQQTDMSAWELTQRGLWMLWQQRAGFHEKAIELFKEAILLDDQFALSHSGLAYAYCHAYKEGILEKQDLDLAIAEANEAVRLDSRDAFSYVSLGRSHLARGEFNEAIAAYDDAIRRNPNHAYGHFGKGYALCLLGFADQAIPHFEKVLELSPRDPQGWSVCVMLSFSHLLTEMPEQALAWAQKAQRMPNAPHWALAAEAAALTVLGEGESAKKAMSDALLARPDLDAAFLDRAYPFANRQDYNKLAGLMLGTFIPASE
ncbi:MAG: winged helix-turn-helix domain-containing protein [Pseudomonadota bacterium]